MGVTAGRIVMATVACLLGLTGCETSTKLGNLLSPTSESTQGLSSPVPDELMPLVRELNPAAAEGGRARMMAVNANMEGLNAVLQAGSTLVATVAAGDR